MEIRIEDDLGEAVAVPQVDENDAPVVAPPMDPAAQSHGLVDMLSSQFVASVGAVHSLIES